MRTADNIPEPLRDFDAHAAALRDALAALDALHTRFRALAERGGILPNSLDALRLELTYNSNAIEGSTLTLRETQLILEGRTPPGTHPLREIYEARNHDRALRTIEAWAAARPIDAPLTERDLLDVHATVLADIDPANAGRFRDARVLIAGTRFVPPGSHRFPELVPALLTRANSPGVHPAVQAAELHYNLAAVHPFADGNGRTARLFMNYVLLRAGYPPTVVEVDRRADYLAALERANNADCTPFLTFIIACAERSIHRLLPEEAR